MLSLLNQSTRRGCEQTYVLRWNGLCWCPMSVLPKSAWVLSKANGTSFRTLASAPHGLGPCGATAQGLTHIAHLIPCAHSPYSPCCQTNPEQRYDRVGSPVLGASPPSACMCESGVEEGRLERLITGRSVLRVGSTEKEPSGEVKKLSQRDSIMPAAAAEREDAPDGDQTSFG